MNEKFFENARELFLTAGWREFIEAIDEQLSGITLAGCNSAEEFWQAKGRHDALQMIAGYENACMAAEAQAEEDDV